VRAQVAVCCLLSAAAFAAGCGSTSAGSGRAQLWVTRDRGAHVVMVRTVPAGLSAMQALKRVADVETRYGGRYVQSIDGVAGSLSDRRDWFYFVNGIEADRGAVEYRLHPGDVEWWDYRSWQHEMRAPVVVGAFPEPFLHGYGGKVRSAAVVGHGAGARALARLTRGRVAASAPAGANVLRLRRGSPRFTARLRPEGGVELVYGGDPMRLARHPSMYRFRYEVR
jgi:Domain of unknown function (DUF4430)